MFRIALRFVRVAVIFTAVAALVWKATKMPMMAGLERGARAKWAAAVKPRIDGLNKDATTAE